MASCGAQDCLNISLLRCCHAEGLLRGCPMAENLHTLLHTLQTLASHLSMQTNSLQTKTSGGAHSCRLLRECPMAETLLLPHFQMLASHLSMQSILAHLQVGLAIVARGNLKKAGRRGTVANWSAEGVTGVSVVWADNDRIPTQLVSVLVWKHCGGCALHHTQLIVRPQQT